MRTWTTIALCVAVLLAWPAGAGAQEPGRIAGRVVDSHSGEPLVGATVRLVGTNTGTVCDVQGRYLLSRVPAGTSTLAVSMIGYRSATVSGVAVQPNVTTKIDVTLRSEAIAVEETVVEAMTLRNNEASLLRERQKAPAVSDAISAEAISRAASGDAADAVKHVTGASILGGKYVVMRGLSDRYTTVQLNGAPLPSADPDKHAVPVDLFPSSLLENIVAVKSFTPNQSGNFTGGSVNLSTRSLLERFSLSLSATTSYNTQTSLRHGFLGGEQGRWDWLGFDAGTRELPAALKDGATQVPDIGSAFGDRARASALDALSKSFSPTIAPTARRAPLNHSYSVGLGRRLDLWGRPAGLLATLSYNRSFSAYRRGTAASWQLAGQANQVSGLTNNYALSDTRSTAEVLWGGLLNASWAPAPTHELGLTALYNRNGEDVGRYLVGSLPRDMDPEAVYETRVLQFTERSIQSAQLHGKHQLERLRGLEAEWMASRARTTQNEPDLRYFTDDFRAIDWGTRVDTVFSITTGLYPPPTRYYRTMEESNLETRLDLSLPLRHGRANSGSFRFGGSLLDVDRTFRERRFQVRQDALRYDGDAQAFLEGTNVGLVDSTAGPYRFSNYVVDASEKVGNYDGEQRVSAGYAMLELRLGQRFRVVTGARFEGTRMDAASGDSSLAAGRLRNHDWLPSINLIQELRPTMNLRAAYGRTLARPTFRELAPYASFDFVGDFIFVGNPRLRRTFIDNYDLRWESFPRPGEIAAVSLFHKRFHQPIERAIRTVNGEVQYQNVDRAHVSGVEFEIRRGLEGLHESLGNLLAGANLSLVRSEVSVPTDELVLRRALDPEARGTRSLQGQSPFVANLDLSYERLRDRTSAGLHYNLFGRRLSEVSLGGTPDVYESPRGTLDLTLAKGINHVFRLKVAAKNLLDTPVRRVYPFQGRSYVAQEYRTGRSISVGLAYHRGE